MRPSFIRTVSEGTKRFLASSHIAGPELADALNASNVARRAGYRTTISFWPPPSYSPIRVAEEHRRIVASEELRHTNAIVSIKPHLLGYDLGLIEELIARAEETGFRVCLDALSPDRADITFRLLQRLLVGHKGLIWTIPSRWRRSLADASRAVDLGLDVRLVKGQWLDPDAPRLDPVDHFLRLADRLADSPMQVLVATHDEGLAIDALKILRSAGTRCELEQMFGLPIRHHVLDHVDAEALRIYIPYGSGDLPYNLSTIRSRPAVAGWAVRDLVLGRKGKLLRLSGVPFANGSRSGNARTE